MRKKDSATHSMYNTPVSHNTESDDSDSEEMLPTGAFWPIPESEEWTVVKRSHGNLRGTIGSGRDRFQNPGKKLRLFRIVLWSVRRYQQVGKSRYRIRGAVD